MMNKSEDGDHEQANADCSAMEGAGVVKSDN